MEKPRPPSEIRLTPRFKRHVKRRLTRTERAALASALRLFVRDAYDPALETHNLGGKLSGRWAFGFGYDARVVFAWDGQVAVLLDVGTHEEVYG